MCVSFLLVELCVPLLSMPVSFFLHCWCPPACIKSLSPSPCLCFPFPSPTSFYSHRNVWYVDQQTGCVIFPLSSREKPRRGRGGEKQPCCHLHSCILHHLSSPSNKGHHTPNLWWPFTSVPSHSHAHAVYLAGNMKQDHWSHLCSALKIRHLDFFLL